MLHIIKTLNHLREKYINNLDDLNKLPESLIKDLEQDTALSKVPLISYLIADLKEMHQNSCKSLKYSKNHINNNNDGFVCSIFKASYFPSLSLDAFYYEKLKVPTYLKQRYPAPVLPVNLVAETKGFSAKEVVALFPENYINQLQLPSDKIFYFINKFVDRFEQITYKLIKEIIVPDYFSDLLQASRHQIEYASIQWVWLHEYHHRQGMLPIPQYLSLKSTKALAGLEELRVDLCSIVALLENDAVPKEDAIFASKFILAERLLRYAVEGIPKPNYDAIASQLLFNYLLQNSGIYLMQEKIKINECVFEVAIALLNEINAIESNIIETNQDDIKYQLLKFTKKFTNYNDVKNQFEHIDYFALIKQRLNV